MSNRDFLLEQLLDVAHHPVILGVKGIRLAEQMAEEIIDTLQNQNKLGFFGADHFAKAAELLAVEFRSGLAVKRGDLPVVLINNHCPAGNIRQNQVDSAGHKTTGAANLEAVDNTGRRTAGEERPVPDGRTEADPIVAKIDELLSPGDLLFLLTQEASKSISQLMIRARERKIKTLLLCGYPLPKGLHPDRAFCIPLPNPLRLEEVFIIFGHLVGIVVESVLFSGENGF
ncbi:MAG TPA: hypothetical protein VIL66_06840 [Bacillota bacterium]